MSEMVLTWLERLTGQFKVRSDVWQRPNGFTWTVWHGLGDREDSEWVETGFAANEDVAYDAIRAAVVDAARRAGIDVPDQPKEIRVVREHFDA